MLSIRLGTGDLARYPFLNEAGEYLRQSGFGWEELDRPDMADIIQRAAERIVTGVSGKVYDKLERYETEILTFLVTLIMVKSIGMEPVLKKYALAEARRAEKFLTEDLKRQNDAQRQALLSKIFGDLFGLAISTTHDGRLFKVKVTDYLARSSHFHEQEWKMINRLVSNGHVYLGPDETVRLVRNELAVMINSRVHAMSLPVLPKAIKDKTDALRAELAPHYEYRTHSVTEYPPCFSEGTEILTIEGWKDFRDINTNDLVATRKLEDNTIEYQKPTEIISQYCEGDIIKVKTDALDIEVTPNHRMIVMKYKLGNRFAETRIITAEEMFNSRGEFMVPRVGEWRGIEPEYFELEECFFKHGFRPLVQLQKIRIPFRTWVQFMALWLSEGTHDRSKGMYRVRVSQKTQIELARKILYSIPFNWRESPGGRGATSFEVASKQLYNEVRKYGYTKEKYVPDYIKKASVESIKEFLGVYCKCDGYVRKNGSRVWITTSKSMADDIQELLFKCGIAANIGKHEGNGRLWYYVAERIRTPYSTISPRFMKRIPYKGKVYCVTVPNGIIYVRRNGKALWSGNCVKHAIEVMNRGENLPHSARLMLATYMLAIDKPTDEIVEMFKNAPDFNERITRYQVEHLAGSKGSRTKYSVPSCDKLRTENLCFATKDCDGIINPIQFGRRRK